MQELLPPAHGRPLRVLLVEDSKVLSERVSAFLRNIVGVQLIGVTDSEVVATAVAAQEHVEVIVLDLHLKQGTGFGVMRALTAMPRRPKIIVFTNYDLPEYKLAAKALGAGQFLDKARDLATLSQLLQAMTARN
jgi:two-component system, OmpR family, response regulator